MQTRSMAPSMPVRTLVPFFVIAFGLTWGLAALLILFTDQIVAIFGEISTSNPLFILAVYSPGIAGMLLVSWHYGLKGLIRFLRRLTAVNLPIAPDTREARHTPKVF